MRKKEKKKKEKRMVLSLDPSKRSAPRIEKQEITRILGNLGHLAPQGENTGAENYFLWESTTGF